MSELLKLLKHCLTGIDGESYDVARVLLFLGGIAFIVYSGYHVWHNRSFDFQSYGIGLGSILGGGGAGIGLKAKTEPSE